MMNVRRILGICAVLACCLLPRAHAVTITGTLAGDDAVVQIPFSTTTTQNYTFTTTSYATGGFDPVLSLFNASGTLYPGLSASNGGSDAVLSDLLGPGSYILALSEFPNYSAGTLTSYSGASSIISAACGTSAAFTDAVNCSQRTSAYAVNITSTAATPEPPTALLLLLPLVGVVYLNRRRSAQPAL